MPWVVKVKNTYTPLTDAETKNNAELMYAQIGSRMTLKAICAIMGNIQWESYFNPGQWQGSYDVGDMNGGYGLVMWTPASKIFNIVGYDGAKQVEAILNLTANDWIEKPGTPMSWEEFKTSDGDLDYLTLVFLKNYERAGDEHLPERQQYARDWYTYFYGKPPGPGPGPGPEPGVRKKMPIVFYLRRL